MGVFGHAASSMPQCSARILMAALGGRAKGSVGAQGNLFFVVIALCAARQNQRARVLYLGRVICGWCFVRKRILCRKKTQKKYATVRLFSGGLLVL